MRGKLRYPTPTGKWCNHQRHLLPGPVKLLLFDLDGTLLLTHGAGVRGMSRAGIEVYGPKFTLGTVMVAGGLDPVLHEEAVLASGYSVDPGRDGPFREAYYRNLDAELGKERPVEALPGILDLLSRLREDPRVVVGLLTGNYNHTGPLKLRAAGIDPDLFAVTAWGDDARERPALVGVARERYAARLGEPVNPADIIVIGDTPRDVDCARANGCIAFGVATGPCTVKQLLEAGADHAVENLGDPGPLLALLR